MPKRNSILSKSLKEIGDIQVNDFDFIGLLNKDINEIEKEIVSSLRRLGNTKVIEWDFNTAMPNVSRVAHTEVDIVDFIKRTAGYKVMEWDFRSALHGSHHHEARISAKHLRKTLDRGEMQTLISNLRNFLQYTFENLVDEPNHADLKVREIAPGVLRFTLLMAKRDVSMLIGMEGHTAAAIRRILKAVAEKHGVHALLEILPHDEESRRSQKA